ncbi:cystathionine gamma-lyase-like [Glandiceps talaboti]
MDKPDSNAGDSGDICRGFSTLAVHAGQGAATWLTDSAVVPPISLSSTYRLDDPSGGIASGGETWIYTRYSNPTRSSLEHAIAAAEGGKYGLAFSSGVATIFTITALLDAGDHVVSFNDIYGGTVLQFQRVASKLKIDTTFIEVTDDEQTIKNAIKPNTKMVWIESPSNPTLRVVDIQAIANIVHQHKGIFLVVDGTFASPACQRPLEFGVDIVMHSASKYINGHTDVIMGVLATNREDLFKQLRFLQRTIGAIPSPFDCYMANRGLKTLPLRMEKHQENAMALAKYLESSPRIEEVIYPGLESHPQHEIAKKQMRSFSGMMAVKVKGGKQEAIKFMKSLKIIAFATSLGGVESLIEHPASLSHADLNDKEKFGITDNLLRLSVGIEDTQDLINDVDQALKAAIKDI